MYFIRIPHFYGVALQDKNRAILELRRKWRNPMEYSETGRSTGEAG
jgi:hypothetical protein